MPETIGFFIAKGIASYAIGKGLDKLFEKRDGFEKRLAQVIDSSIDAHHRKSPIPDADGKYAFYKSQVFLEELLKLRLFGDNAYDVNEELLIEQLRQNKNIIPPTKNQLTDFLDIFEQFRKADPELKTLEIEENFREQVFFNSDKLDLLIELITNLSVIQTSVPKELTAVPRLAKYKIVGREQDLSNLRNVLLENKETVLMNGMGGIGKTTLASVYADTFYDDYDHIAWLTIETNLEEAIATNFSLLKNLNLLNVPVHDQFRACLNELRTLEGEKPLLLILDNATANLARYYDMLPKAPCCHLLVTSRERITPFLIIELDFLPEDEAIQLFLKQNDKFSGEQVAALVKHVEYHTLTIEILALSAKKHRWNFEQIMTALTLDAKAEIEISHSGHKKIARIKSYLVNIFNLSVCNEYELYLLKQFLFLPNEWMAYDFLETLLGREQLEWKDDFAGYLESLFERGWIQKDQSLDGYIIHPVLAEAITPQLEINWDDIKLLSESITEFLSLDQAKDNPIEKFQFIPLGDAILKGTADCFSDELARLKNNLATVYQDLGDYEQARDLLEAALTSARKNFGADHPTVAVRQSNLALVYQDLGDYEKARELLEAALTSDQKNFGADHPTVAVSQSNLASVYKALGDYEQARELLEAALASDLKNFGADHPTVAVSQSNLAIVYKYLGDYEQARDLLEAALTSDQKNFGADHPTVAVRQSNLALVHQDLGDYEQARDLLEAALTSDQKNFGADHPNVARGQSNLALVYKDLSDYEQARELLEAALASALKNFGADHPTVAVRQSNLASVYKALGDYEQARDLLEAALTSDQKNFGADHPTVAVRQSNLALVHQDLGDYEQARDLLEAALTSDQKNFGADHPNVARGQSNLALVYKDLGDYEQTRDLLEAALTSDQKNFGADHPAVARNQNNLATVYQNLGDYE